MAPPRAAQPWVRLPRYDGWLLLAPPFVALAVPAQFRQLAELPLLALPQSTHYVRNGFIWHR